MTNPIEMHADVAKVAATLQADPAVAAQFEAAFGTREVTPERIGLALEQYLLTKVSADSKFDRAMAGKEALTEQEKEGFALFMTEYDPARGRRGADCFHCHGGALFTDYDYKNNGLSETSRAERGRENVTGSVDDRDKFRTPSLRNVALTAPYMHDGRFQTLDDVVAHYDHGVTRSTTLDPNLAKHPDAGLQLTRAEQDALVAFLKTLTDEPQAN
jgi:cytochrome c peroxidase